MFLFVEHDADEDEKELRFFVVVVVEIIDSTVR